MQLPRQNMRCPASLSSRGVFHASQTGGRRDWRTFLDRIGRSRKRVRRVQSKPKPVSTGIRVAVTAAAVLAVFSVANVVYQVLRKPAELFAPVSGKFNKSPVETWRQYAPLFHEYSTASV